MVALVRRAVGGASVDVVGALTSGDGRATALARYDARNPRGARWNVDAAVVVFRLSR